MWIMGTVDSSPNDVVSLQIVVAAGSIALGFAAGAVLTWVVRCRNRAKITSARLDCYVPVRPSAHHPERKPDEAPAPANADEPAAPVRSGSERRRHPRLDFFGTQWITPFAGGTLPDQSAFLEVRCLDVSTGGFSFATTERPNYRSILVRFQVGGAPMYLTARIADSRPYDGGDCGSERSFRVGCEFTGRFAAEVVSPSSGGELDESSLAVAGLSQPDASLRPTLQQN